jgi:hypothetical protein
VEHGRIVCVFEVRSDYHSNARRLSNLDFDQEVLQLMVRGKERGGGRLGLRDNYVSLR